VKRALRRRSETRGSGAASAARRSAGRAGVRDVFGTCAGVGAVVGDGVQRVYAQTVPVMREIVVIARMRLRQRRVLNAASLFYLNLSAVSSPSMQVLYGPGAPQTQYGMGVLVWGLTGRRRGVRRVRSWGSKLRVQ